MVKLEPQVQMLFIIWWKSISKQVVTMELMTMMLEVQTQETHLNKVKDV